MANRKYPAQLYSAFFCLFAALCIGGIKAWLEWSYWQTGHGPQPDDSWYYFGMLSPFIIMLVLAAIVLKRKRWAKYALATICGLFAIVGFVNGNFHGRSGSLIVAETVAYSGVIYFLCRREVSSWLSEST